ncbi:hypothetical protein GCM10007421_27350 [Halopseudomonas oceani]|uniref:DUF2845 domain-containing protein n=1 Tax=Halopseudomonas oceani TaxID=1708783 RepID=A0A2P4EU17_9GAMM|nr:DUF2845 domain-containing protein [Halopseudomonas oceani]POB02773.1 hypothetical protein C1949_12275 [Halopseudomonas oceani]GGE51458.1 hypothetical protein GCM10007421_27350 [Halopseudomonas oceani]
MRHIYRITLPLIGLVVGSAVQAATMRCDHGIIATGAMMAEVLEQCGEPDSRQHTPRHIDPDGYPAEGSVTVEHWIYGPSNGMVRELRFIDGRLVDIESTRR